MAWRSLAFWTLAGSAGLSAASALGCGSPDTGDIFGASSDGSGASGSGGAGSGAAGSGASNTGSASAGGDSASGGSGASASGGGTSVGGAGGGTSVGGAGGSPPPPPATLACGNQQCPLGANNACCWDEYELHGQPRAECVVGSVQSDNCATQVGNDGLETRIECQLPSQCNTGICCGRREFFGGQGAYYSDLECANQCDWPDVTVCDPAAPSCPTIVDEGGVTVQTICKPSQLLPQGYSVCGLP